MTAGPTRRRAVHILGHTWCLRTPLALLPFYRLSENRVVLMDCGTQYDGSVADYFSLLGMDVTAVLLTHGHFDHMGGLEALRTRFGCAVHLPVGEAGPYIPRPQELSGQQPSGEELPFSPTRDAVARTPLPPGCTALAVEDASFQVIPCPGHTGRHVAYVTPDGVCYVGDLLASNSYLSAAKLLYAQYHVQDRRSKERMRSTAFPFYVAAHRGVFAGALLGQVIQNNLDHMEQTRQTILSCVMGPIPADGLMEAVSAALSLAPASRFDRYINRCCICGYLEDLVASGLLGEDIRVGERWYFRR